MQGDGQVRVVWQARRWTAQLHSRIPPAMISSAQDAGSQAAAHRPQRLLQR